MIFSTVFTPFNWKEASLVNEAKASRLMRAYALKIAVVRGSGWLAVALFGKSALHYMTNHERAGLGVMHI